VVIIYSEPVELISTEDGVQSVSSDNHPGWDVAGDDSCGHEDKYFYNSATNWRNKNAVREWEVYGVGEEKRF